MIRLKTATRSETQLDHAGQPKPLRILHWMPLNGQSGLSRIADPDVMSREKSQPGWVKKEGLSH